MSVDPDTCERGGPHIWQLDKSREVLRLKCKDCPAVKDYAEPPTPQPAEPCPTQTNKPD